MRKKRSFFERLTGGGRDDYEEADDVEQEVAVRAGDDEAEEDEKEEGQLTIDMYQTSDDIVIRTMVAGVRPEDLDIAITRDMVTIRGERQEAKESSGDDYFHQELYWGTFSRNIILPQEIDIEGAEATEKHGLLIIRLPKLDKTRQTKLRVKSN